MSVLTAARTLRDAVSAYPDRAPHGDVAVILNPLDYAWSLHSQYVERFAPDGKRVQAVFLGMNPGPWGMAQTGVPFGTPDLVRDFLGLDAEIRIPANTHPKRPIRGLTSPRNEVSGQRLWGAVRDRFGTPEAFFERFYIANWNPLVFQGETGKNLTPDKLPKAFLAPCRAACEAHLVALLETLQPEMVIGVGRFAERQAREVVKRHALDIAVGNILHPSPASPLANRGWLQAALPQLEALGHPW